MRAVLESENDGKLTVTLTMTREELVQAERDPQVLAEAVREACGEAAGSTESAQPEAGGCETSAETKEPVSEVKEFVYKGFVPDDISGGKEAVIDRMVRLLIEKNEIPVNMAAVEQEAEFNFKAVVQKMRYDVMFRGASEEDADMDPDRLMEEIREELIFEQRENFIFQKIIEGEGFEASPEELLAEAEEMARRQETTVEMVKSFFGEDLAGLAGDVKKRKAKDFLYVLATRRAILQGKKEQRKLATARRRALTQEERDEKSRVISERLIGLLGEPRYSKVRTIFSYRATWDEVNVDMFNAWAEAHGYRVAYPISLPHGIMKAAVPENENSWHRAAYDILEPIAEQSELLKPEDIDLIIVPCVAFDAQGNRCGHGAGYYDRFMVRMASEALVMAAFEAQRMEKLVTEQTDLPIKTVVTEAEIIDRC